MKRKLILFALLTMLCPVLSHAQVTAATCNESDVSKAWASVTSSTTTFTIPSGSCAWTSQLNLTVPSGSASLTIQGSTTVSGDCNSSACTAADNTVLTDNCTSCGSGPLLQITTAAAASVFRFTGITFKGGNGGPEFNGQLSITGTSQNVRVDHNHFNTASYSPANASLVVWFGGWLYGVADHNVFDLSTAAINGSNNGVHVNHETWGNALDNGTGEGDGSWADSTTFGSNRFIYIENNTFNYGYVNDCGGGGRFVMRYNYINESTPQTHPTQGGNERARGCRAAEIYQNNFVGTNGYANPPQAMFRQNSGTSLIWGNSAPAGYQTIVFLYNYRATGTSYGVVNTPSGWGACGTAYNGTASNWDQNSNSTGHRCLDNPGTGKGDLLTGGFSSDGTGTNNVTNSATGCGASQACAWPRQASEPIYTWLNNWAPIPSNSQPDINNGTPSALVVNSDYYPYCSASNPSGYTCTTAFNGTVGTGSGLLSARPFTCTPFVGYWATDTNTLYQCASTNNWSSYYTPYTYPHPLVQGQSSGTGPAAPTNLTATVQ